MSDYFPLDCSEKLGRIGLLVKQRRLELKMRQSDLASSVGVSNPTIGRIEAGERRVELGTFMHVLWQLGLLDEVIAKLDAASAEEPPQQRVRLKKPKRDEF
ncbi:MAG: helix-turn-helix domain-containing protein [Kaiparowitsia implicata GSE-PSE-MK54-09C]|jgi:DNA-binding XRE family transcriptional regulator|nr:helix-turn-helix domain-containing protein [Kaiparowitsia implicata GSE-PSE-MK54-09C]